MRRWVPVLVGVSHTMERYSFVRAEKGAGRKLRPVLAFVRVELSLDLAA